MTSYFQDIFFPPSEEAKLFYEMENITQSCTSLNCALGLLSSCLFRQLTTDNKFYNLFLLGITLTSTFSTSPTQPGNFGIKSDI